MSETATETPKPKRKSYRDIWATKLSAKLGVTSDEIKGMLGPAEKAYEVSPRVKAINDLIDANATAFAALAEAIAAAKGEDTRTLGIYVDKDGAHGKFGRTGTNGAVN